MLHYSFESVILFLIMT